MKLIDVVASSTSRHFLDEAIFFIVFLTVALLMPREACDAGEEPAYVHNGYVHVDGGP